MDATDTDNNSADFAIANPPTPRNTASAFHYCTGPPIPLALARPLRTHFLSSILLADRCGDSGHYPTSTSLTVTCDLTAIDGSARQALL